MDLGSASRLERAEGLVIGLHPLLLQLYSLQQRKSLATLASPMLWPEAVDARQSIESMPSVGVNCAPRAVLYLG